MQVSLGVASPASRQSGVQIPRVMSRVERLGTPVVTKLNFCQVNRPSFVAAPPALLSAFCLVEQKPGDRKFPRKPRVQSIHGFVFTVS